MSCKQMLVLATLVACTDEPIVVDVSATATKPAQLSPQAERISDDEPTYIWELILAPDSSGATLTPATQAMVFTPDVRGIYVIERWIVYGVSERLTHRFVVQANGLAPEAIVAPGATVAIGSPVALDGSMSRSGEGRDLVFRWRLAARPQASGATIAMPDAPTSGLTPDFAGSYSAELLVFDGELWSVPATVDIVAQ